MEAETVQQNGFGIDIDPAALNNVIESTIGLVVQTAINLVVQ